MITSNKNYPFGGRVSTVESPLFRCMISTAKEGFFRKQSVMISDFSDGMQNRSHIAKITYPSHLSSKQRLAIHDAIVAQFEESATSGVSLHATIHKLIDELTPLGAWLMPL